VRLKGRTADGAQGLTSPLSSSSGGSIMLRKLIVFAITSGLAKKLYQSVMNKRAANTVAARGRTGAPRRRV